ncbi:MAG: RHS repeat-associated core domain-containing protein [Acidimicrobiales bacterium]
MRQDETGQTVYYHPDALANVGVLTDAAGAPAVTYTYDPYGVRRASSTVVFQPLGFAGQYHDAETGLVYLRARYYDPTTAQFLTPDPLEGGSCTPYDYACGDPINGGDPSGMILDTVADLGFIGHDLFKLFTDGGQNLTTNLSALGLDVAGAAIPFATGLGPASRAARTVARADDATDVAKVARASKTSLFRSVSTAEADDIARFGGFRAGSNSYEGKLFASTAEDAARYGRINNALTPGGSPFHIVETRIPTSLANSFERMTLDGMQAVHVAESQLGALNVARGWRAWDWVPWVGKPGAGL